MRYGCKALARAGVGLMVAAAATLQGASAMAGEHCYGERVVQVMVNQGTVAFSTDKSCRGWCVLPANLSETAKDRHHAMLLTALATKRPLLTYFDAATTPCQLMPGWSQVSFLVVYDE